MGVVAEITGLRHHVAHRPRLGSANLAFADGGACTGLRLRSRHTRKKPRRALQILEQDATGSRGIEADRCPDLRIPEFAAVEFIGPGTLDDADKSILAFHRRSIAVWAKCQNFSVRRDRPGGGAARQGDLVSL